jgi:hypothetical protein
MVLIACAICTSGPFAFADDAAAIFARAVSEHDSGKCEDTPVGDAATCARAADDFKEVYASNPAALGALRNLAYTERGLGRIASAAKHFRELAEKAPNDPKPERRAWAKFAAQEADSLSARVPTLTVRLATPTPSGLAVTLDGVAFSSIDTPLALDPGAHRLHAEAAGFQPFDALVRLDEHDQKIVEVQLAPNSAPPLIASAPPTRTPPRAPKEAPTHHSHLAPVVITLAGAGVTALGLGLGLGALVERNSNCDAQKVCADDSLQTAHDLADASTLLVVVGSVALAGGLIWYFAIPSDSNPHTVAITATPRSVNATIRF